MYKRSSTIIFSLLNNKLVCFNYLLNKKTEISLDLLSVLRALEEWKSLDYIKTLFDHNYRNYPQKTIHQLIDYGILVQKDTPEAISQDNFQLNWKWGIETALYVCGLNFTKFTSYDKNPDLYLALQNKIQKAKDVSLYHSNRDYEIVVSDKKPNIAKGLMKIMSSRRTVRYYDENNPISKSEIFSLLFAGLGILSFREVRPFGKLPLKMTPSGGARNPFDAIVLCNNVRGIERGIYKYSPTEHSLGLITNQIDPSISSVLGDQKWIDKASAVILLVANVMRTMYKYEHFSAYRVMLIEAGHIAQNMSLIARDLGLYTSTTAAIDYSAFVKMLNVERNDMFKNAIYAIAVGHIDPNNSDLTKQ